MLPLKVSFPVYFPFLVNFLILNVAFPFLLVLAVYFLFLIFNTTFKPFIPLPLLCLYHNLYYHGTWFKALDAQLGADVSYNTSYYAPFFDPAIGQFVLQNTEKVGNYPMIGVYANFFVRSIKLRFFLRYDHLNTTFMNGDMRGNYFSIPAYPLNPGMFRAGLAFHFYN